MKSEKLWSSFGKLSLVVGVIAGVLYVSSEVNSKQPDISAICSYNAFDIPPDIHSTLLTTWDYDTWTNLETFIDTVKSERYYTHSIVNHLRTYVQSLFPETVSGGMSPYSAFFSFTIINEGDLIADDLVLDGPSTGICRVINRDNSQTVSEFNYTLELGSIRPGDEIKVYLWATSSVYRPEGDFRLTYSEGLGEIRFPSTHYGFRRCVADNLELIIVILICASLIIALVMAVYLPDSSKDESSKEQNTENDETVNPATG
ncbi:MAG: hypothetical protein ABIA75_07250 [Candidatus Neomarinimicrobiota bacterium]